MSDQPQTSDQDEQPIIVPGAPPRLNFIVQVTGFGFTFPEGIRRDLTVDRDDPAGVTVEFAVIAAPVDRRAARTLEVSFEYEGERCGQAWHDVVVTNPEAAGLTPGSVFNAHPEYVRKDVAEAAREDMRRAAHQGRADTVFLAASGAAWIYLALGDRPQFLINRLDALQALFMISEAESEYGNVREQALELHQMAREISSQPIMFESLVLAADCSWFSTGACPAGWRAGAGRGRGTCEALGRLHRDRERQRRERRASAGQRRGQSRMAARTR